MRILVVSAFYPPNVAGAAEMYTAWITEALRARGHELTVLAGWEGRGVPQDEDGVRRLLKLYPSQRYDSSASLRDRLQSAYLYYRCHNSHHNGAIMRQTLGAVEPDLVYLTEPSGLGLNSLLRAINAARLPLVIHLHNYWLIYLRRPTAEHSQFRNAWLKKLLVGPVPKVAYTSMIAVSRMVKEEHIRAGFPAQRIEVIYNGLPPDQLPEVSPGLRRDPPRFLFAGRLVGEKGVHVAVKALAHLVTRLGVGEAYLDIVGEGYPSYEAELKALSQSLGVSGYVTLCGKLERTTLLSRFADYTAVLVPSLWMEPLGTTVLEAMARGVPVIGSRLGGHTEIIEDGGNGLLFGPGDTAHLAERMYLLLSDPTLRERIAGNALSTAREKLGFETFIDKVEAHLERALAAAGASLDSGPMRFRSPTYSPR